MSIKRIVALLTACLLGAGILAVNNLNMHIDSNRFLDKEKNTILLLDYQVPYSNLIFLARNGGYFAELKVGVTIATTDSVIVDQEVDDIIGISNKFDASNKQKSYLNRLSYILPKGNFQVRFEATDVNSQKTFVWDFEEDSLPGNALMSDVELNLEVRADTLNYLPKFQRNKVLYLPQPSILVNKSLSDFVYLYLEIYPQGDSTNGNNLLNLLLEKDSLIVMDEYIDFKPGKTIDSINLTIPVAELSPGMYSGSVVVQAGESTEERNFEFVLYEEKEDFVFLFSNPDDEYELMRYFWGNKLPPDWKGMDMDKKRRYGTQFWQSMAQSTKRSVKDILRLVQERIDYANRYFSHLKPGWTSDMGRIYIRNGAADEITRDTSSDKSRFVRKDYQIWKYSTGNKPVYVFIDIQMNGNFRLIYAADDDLESSNPDWLRYLGTDFENSLLNN